MQFSEHPVYREFLRLLTHLDDLMAAGRGASEADAIRDDMEDIYWELSAAERQRLNGISADLYMLHGQEVSEKLSEGETQKQLEQTTWNAWAEQDMEMLLRCLRKAPDFLGWEAVASLRAYAYEALDDLPVALPSKDLASRINPSDIGHRLGFMALLFRLGALEDAVAEARRIVRHPNLSDAMRADIQEILSKAGESKSEVTARNSFAVAKNEAGKRIESLLAAA